MISISVGDQDTCVIATKVDGKVHTQYARWQDAQAILTSKTGFHSGLLPANCRHYSFKGSCHLVAFDFPAKLYKILVKHDRGGGVQTIDDVPLPAGLWVLKLIEKPGVADLTLASMALTALKSPGLVDENTVLYRWPTPNVETDGRVCWGYDQHVIGGIKKISAVAGIHIAFMKTYFNDHWWYQNSLATDYHYKGFGYREVEKYFTKLAGEGTFPEEVLTPARNSMTFKQCLDLVSGRTSWY